MTASVRKPKKLVYLTNIDDHQDHYVGSRKPELIYGFRGDDTIFGARGDDLIKGGLGLDWLFGGSGNDRLLGEGGDDFIFGGCGDDVMTGGDGSDTFEFGVRAGTDKITDFFSGTDVIEFVAEGAAGLAAAVIDKIRYSTNMLHAVIEWSWQDQSNKLVLTNVTLDLAQADFHNFSFSDQALEWFL
jgi:Ca2+-binding RTX toxin-like protein